MPSGGCPKCGQAADNLAADRTEHHCPALDCTSARELAPCSNSPATDIVDDEADGDASIGFEKRGQRIGGRLNAGVDSKPASGLARREHAVPHQTGLAGAGWTTNDDSTAPCERSHNPCGCTRSVNGRIRHEVPRLHIHTELEAGVLNRRDKVDGAGEAGSLKCFEPVSVDPAQDAGSNALGVAWGGGSSLLEIEGPIRAREVTDLTGKIDSNEFCGKWCDSLWRSEEARVFEERACGHPHREETLAAVASSLLHGSHALLTGEADEPRLTSPLASPDAWPVRSKGRRARGVWDSGPSALS